MWRLPSMYPPRTDTSALILQACCLPCRSWLFNPRIQLQNTNSSRVWSKTRVQEIERPERMEKQRTWTREAPEVRTRINSTKEDKEYKEYNGRVYAIAKMHISDRCKIKKCTRRNFREKRMAQMCEELEARQSFSVKPLVARELRQTKKRRTSTTLWTWTSVLMDDISLHLWERLALMSHIFDIVIFMDERLPHERSNSFSPKFFYFWSHFEAFFLFFWQSFAQKIN